MLHTLNNTDGNKLVIFSGIALYYGDNYIVRCSVVVMVVVNCNYAVMDYLLYLIVSNLG